MGGHERKVKQQGCYIGASIRAAMSKRQNHDYAHIRKRVPRSGTSMRNPLQAALAAQLWVDMRAHYCWVPRSGTYSSSRPRILQVYKSRFAEHDYLSRGNAITRAW